MTVRTNRVVPAATMTPASRVLREPRWPDGGAVSRPMDERRYEVQAYTGYPVSTVPKGRWSRGTLTRFMGPEFRPPLGPLYMNDPVNPTRFTLVVSNQRRRGLIPARTGGRRGRK